MTLFYEDGKTARLYQANPMTYVKKPGEGIQLLNQDWTENLTANNTPAMRISVTNRDNIPMGKEKYQRSIIQVNSVSNGSRIPPKSAWMMAITSAIQIRTVPRKGTKIATRLNAQALAASPILLDKRKPALPRRVNFED